MVCRLLLFVLLTLCLLSACSAASHDRALDDPALQSVAASVTRVELEGGFYGLIAESGERYDPDQLPEAFRVDGLKVQVLLRKRPPGVTTRMWGVQVEVVSIERR